MKNINFLKKMKEVIDKREKVLIDDKNGINNRDNLPKRKESEKFTKYYEALTKFNELNKKIYE